MPRHLAGLMDALPEGSQPELAEGHPDGDRGYGPHPGRFGGGGPARIDGPYAGHHDHDQGPEPQQRDQLLFQGQLFPSSSGQISGCALPAKKR